MIISQRFPDPARYLYPSDAAPGTRTQGKDRLVYGHGKRHISQHTLRRRIHFFLCKFVIS